MECVRVRGSVRAIVRDVLKHVRSTLSYGGAATPAALRGVFARDPSRYVIRLSESGRSESFDR
jgi:hypothetical protein